MKKFSHIILSLSVLALTGCMSVPVAPGMGDKEDAKAPRLVNSTVKDEQGRFLPTWDRPTAFGKVSGNLKSIGDIACMRARADLESIGYHSKAEGMDGNAMVGGGFFCWAKANGDKQDVKAPQLVRDGNTLSWDRPSAFGAVPEAVKTRGAQVCSSIGNFVAIGYHSDSRDEAGKPIVGGGFLCAAKLTG